MLERIMEMDTYVYILWGIGVLGLLFKMMANTYLKSLIKASENMATTKKKKLQIIARKYKNRQSLGMNNSNGDAYVEKNVRQMRFITRPFEFWQRCGNTFAFIVAALVAGAFLYYDVSWRGSPEMVLLIANGVCVCAFLFALENIFLISNKVEILKANIRDYIDNLTPAREPVRKTVTVGHNTAGTNSSHREAAATMSEVTDRPAVNDDASGSDVSSEMVDRIKEVAQKKHLEEGSDEVRASPKNDVMLDSFLREFFS